MQHCVPSSRKRPRTNAGRCAGRLRRQIGSQIRDLRTDAGISLRSLADAAGIDAGYLAQVEQSLREPSISVLAAIGDALGADLSVRLYANTGPRARDHIQAAIVEELLRIADPRWQRFTEVPVYRPARGRIDVVLHDPRAAIVIATEVHSQVRRLEQQQGWANLKAQALPSADFWRHLDREPAVSQLLVLRSTRATRELAKQFESTLRAAYPARVRDAFAALTGDEKWLAKRTALGRRHRSCSSNSRSTAARCHGRSIRRLGGLLGVTLVVAGRRARPLTKPARPRRRAGRSSAQARRPDEP